MADLLSDDEIEKRLGELDGWSREGDRIAKTFDNGDFVGSVEFVDRDTARALAPAGLDNSCRLI